MGGSIRGEVADGSEDVPMDRQGLAFDCKKRRIRDTCGRYLVDDW